MSDRTLTRDDHAGIAILACLVAVVVYAAAGVAYVAAALGDPSLRALSMFAPIYPDIITVATVVVVAVVVVFAAPLLARRQWLRDTPEGAP